MDKYLHLCSCKTPLRYEGNYCRSSLQDKKTDFLRSGGGSEEGRTCGLFLQLFLGGLGEGHGAAGLGAGGVVILQHLSGNSNMLPLIFGFTVSGPWLPPAIHFTWENEEEKCRIWKRVQNLFLEIP